MCWHLLLMHWANCGGVDWGQLSAAPATDSALEGGLSPAKGPVID